MWYLLVFLIIGLVIEIIYYKNKIFKNQRINQIMEKN